MHLNSFFIFLFSLFTFNLNAQFYSDHFIVTEDTITKKSHIKSFIAAIAIDGSIWAIDRYIGKTNFSIISTETIRKTSIPASNGIMIILFQICLIILLMEVLILTVAIITD